MKSKEKQARKNLNVENNLQENEGGEQAPVKNGEEARPLGGGEGREPGGNVKRGRVWRLAPDFRWGIPNRHTDHSEVGDDVERFTEQMMEIRRKIREQQVRHYMCPQIPEPDNHDDFCLIP
ncbi:protein BEX4-like isoform 1-T2 [Trichechus inunguis]|uniref:Protein BEX4 n=1 Tax=Trichechus manatus latirostris TaxID=127582 RepID=A0A2Y9RVK7_TRIMA|nr:protein BEX4 [Trichechus manatus latirostris]